MEIINRKFWSAKGEKNLWNESVYIGGKILFGSVGGPLNCVAGPLNLLAGPLNDYGGRLTKKNIFFRIFVILWGRFFLKSIVVFWVKI